MNSSMFAGERRWASARRGGMTGLGKVSVPKPLNLPSQRLENHGLDPNVEIVPKGTLSWGSRPSSSGSNAWVSSAPNADGGTTSPSNLSEHPSSGGSGTRPSTAGSDRTYEPVTNARSNSRPSSASGTLTSNQTSLTSLRPRSAETRPNGSQLSRFAEPVSESSVAWGASSTAERLGVKSTKEDGFSLSSGDFPTLGSEKENSVKNIESQDHGRPSSASGRIAQAKGDTNFHSVAQLGTVNTLRTDGSRSAEDGIYPSMGKWQGEPQQYFNAKVPSQHFDALHVPPVNTPAGAWYRGRPGGPAFRAPIAPGGFPVEPFSYYHPHIPPPSVGSQPVPPAGAGPRGPHPKNGDLYRPQMPDAYARPGMPFRPGFFHGPRGPPGPMTFEGYYGPPMGYCNNEMEIPFMGTAARPPVYNGYPAPGALDCANSYGRASGHGSSGRTLSEQLEADHQGQQRVHLKKHNDWDRKEEGENWDGILSNVLYPGKSILPIIASRKNEWGAEEEADENLFSKRTIPSDNSACNFEYQEHSSDSVRVKPFEGIGNAKAVNNNWTNKLPSAASFPQEMPQLPLASERNPSLPAATKDSSLMQKLELPAATKDSSLMQKLESLNAKVRASDGQCQAPNAFNREEWRSRSQVEMKINNYSVEISHIAGSFERTPVSADFALVPHQEIVPVVDKAIQLTAVASRSSYHGGQVRFDHPGKGKFNSHDADGWGMKPLTPESSGVISSTRESVSNNHVRGLNFVGKTAENSMIDSVGKVEAESFVETCDSSDIQRAKMREVAKQRALQLQKEEEERTREQKAKAFAKLEELNRRTRAGEAANQKAETTQSIGDIQGEHEESCPLGESGLVDPQFQANQKLGSDSHIPALDVSKNLPLKTPHTGLLETTLSHGQSLHMKEDDHNASARKVATQVNDGGISRRNRAGYKQKQNNLQKTSIEKSVANVGCEAPKDLTSVAANITLTEAASSEIQSSGMSTVPNTSNTVAEPSIQQRRKSFSRKNKHKLDEDPVFPSSPVLSDSNPGKEFIENGESKASLSILDTSVSTLTDPNGGVQAAEVFSSLPNEEAHSRVTNQWKHQPFRRTSRSQQSNKFMDKLHGSDTVIWAPVRTQNKADSGIEVGQQSTLESANATNSDNMAQNSSKSKRAEMERYVPKPVAKELAQQGSIPPMPYSINSSKSDEALGKGQSLSVSSASQPMSSATAFIGSSVEIKEGDDRHNKLKKEHGTWRQRRSTDSSHMKGVHLGSFPIFEPGKDVQKSIEQHQYVKSVINSAIAESNTSSSISTSDGYNTSNNATIAAVGKIPAVKDQGATVRGKRHLPRVRRSTGDNHDHGDILSGETDGSRTQSAAPNVDQTDRIISSKDNPSLGEQTSSHWQPKSNSNSANSRLGNKTAGSETVITEITRASKKDHPSQHNVQVPPQHDKQSRNTYQPQPGPSVFESNVAGELIVGHHQEFREKKPFPAKEPPYSMNQDPINSVESAPSANTNFQHEHDNPSGSRRSGKQNSQSVRGHEAHGDWSSGQDKRPTYTPAFRERQRQNAHYEYQPVGPYKNSELSKLDGPADGANNVGPRYRERGQSHPKRGGNSYS